MILMSTYYDDITSLQSSGGSRKFSLGGGADAHFGGASIISWQEIGKNIGGGLRAGLEPPLLQSDSYQTLMKAQL